MDIKQKKIYVIASIVFCALAMSLVDSVLQPGYVVKSGIKICLFLIVPIAYFFVNAEQKKELKRLFVPKKKHLLLSLALGGAVFGAIIGGYFLLRGVIDFSGITNNLTQTAGVKRENFVWVALYISIVNSLLEEFFFRGYGFLHLKSLISRKAAYSVSAGLFALYHVGMTATMFDSVWLFLLSFIGLYIGGVLFNILDEKSESIYASWIVHMFANLAINTIGMILFGIL